MVITFIKPCVTCKTYPSEAKVVYKQKGFHKREDQTRRNVFVLIETETNMASSNEHKELNQANLVALSQILISLGKNPLRPEQPFLLNVLICHWIHLTNPTVEDWTLLESKR